MQDFANLKHADQLAHGPDKVEKDWSVDMSSLLLGFLLGAFACLIGLKIKEQLVVMPIPIEQTVIEQKTEKKAPVLEFYEALKSYEVLPRGRN